jgi:uncharacterized protein (DUF924 family)
MSAAEGRAGGAQAEPGWVREVLHYWFDEVGSEHWFKSSREVDSKIRERFLSLHRQISASQASDFKTMRALLAAIIVLDQFSRNIFRDTPSAYATDPLARQLADAAIRRGCDTEMSLAQRQFIYMPFQHSEDPNDQVRSVGLFATLGNNGWTEYAVAHKAIIDRFGRFPHRNAILGRESSAEEIASLSKPMGSF